MLKTSEPDRAGLPSTGVSGLQRGRASWTGILQFSLVAVPVKAYPATSTADTIGFNQLHAPCKQRIRYEKHCPIHGKVEAAEIVKGYPYAPDQYVVVEDSELEQLRPAKEKALLLEQFVEAGQIEPVMLSGRTLYLFPDGLPAQRPYLLLAEAMHLRTCCAVGRITMTGRRYAVVVRPLERLLAMHVLHDPALAAARGGAGGGSAGGNIVPGGVEPCLHADRLGQRSARLVASPGRHAGEAQATDRGQTGRPRGGRSRSGTGPDPPTARCPQAKRRPGRRPAGLP